MSFPANTQSEDLFVLRRMCESAKIERENLVSYVKSRSSREGLLEGYVESREVLDRLEEAERSATEAGESAERYVQFRRRALEFMENQPGGTMQEFMDWGGEPEPLLLSLEEGRISGRDLKAIIEMLAMPLKVVLEAFDEAIEFGPKRP